MIILKILVIAVGGIILLNILKNTDVSISSVLRVVLITLVFTLVIPEFRELLDIFESISFPEGVSIESIKIMFKAFGILCAGSIASDICKDNGESALGNVIELCVRVVSISISLPVISGVISVATAFMNG